MLCAIPSLLCCEVIPNGTSADGQTLEKLKFSPGRLVGSLLFCGLGVGAGFGPDVKTDGSKNEQNQS